MNTTSRKQSAMAWLAELQAEDFPSVRAERDRHHYVETAIHGAVARFGQTLTEQAQAFAGQVRERRTVAGELLELLEHKANLAADGTLTNAEIAHYEQVMRDADRLTAALEADARNAEWHLKRLENPLDAYDEMQKKYPPLMQAL